ncbi:hypothetical protein BDW22DRAFT_1359139 [Trametopsis cervina]|nr:hypothetical protein BDW22DRAFT_1359139 [Trametopsis cervina]
MEDRRPLSTSISELALILLFKDVRLISLISFSVRTMSRFAHHWLESIKAGAWVLRERERRAGISHTFQGSFNVVMPYENMHGTVAEL